jgi:hypothetical protein
LTNPQDRERYAAIVLYLQALPPEDEFRHLAELLGLLSLLGQRLPDALAESLAELRAQTKASTEYHAQVDGRLARLPQEIAAGVDVSAVAKDMSEAFRQQFGRTGLQEAAALLNLSVGEIKSLSGLLGAALKPVTQEYRGIASALASETAKLVSAARQVEEHNVQLIVQERSNRRPWQGILALLLFLAGGVCGILIEKGQTTDLLSDIDARVQRVQTPAIRTAPPAKSAGGRPSAQE